MGSIRYTWHPALGRTTWADIKTSFWNLLVEPCQTGSSKLIAWKIVSTVMAVSSDMPGNLVSIRMPAANMGTGTG